MRIVSGKFKGRVLKSPKGNTTRPTTSMAKEAIFNRCQYLIENACVLDLFAGSGAIGFEALSRGAKFITFIEQNPIAAKCISENAIQLGVEKQIEIFQKDAFQAVHKLKQVYDFIYIDPPYDLNISSILDEIGSRQLLKTGGILFLEERYKKTSPPKIANLQYIDSRKYGEAHIHQYQPLEPS